MKVPRWLITIGQILLVGLVTYGIVRALAPEVQKITIADLRAWQPNVVMLILSTFMLVCMYLAHFMLWRSITTRLGGIRPSAKAGLRIFFLSSLGRYIPGKLWQIAGLAIFAQRTGLSPVAATAASLAGQFGFLTSGLVYLLILMPRFGGLAPASGLAALGIVALAAGFAVRRYGSQLARRWGARFHDSLEMLKGVRFVDAVKWWLAYLLTWALLGASFVIFVYAFVPLGREQIVHVAATIAAAYLFGYIMIFSVAGLGIREAAMLTLLKAVMPAPAALLVSVGSRLWFTAAELLPLALIPLAKDE